MEVLTKSCTRCGESKQLCTENFPPHNKTRSGFDSWCRACRSTYRSEINRGKFRNVISDEALKAVKKDVRECVICGSAETLVVDHCHSTGKIRGMLCGHCNRGLGHFRDSPMLLEFATQYLHATSDDSILNEMWERYNEKNSCGEIDAEHF